LFARTGLVQGRGKEKGRGRGGWEGRGGGERLPEKTLKDLLAGACVCACVRVFARKREAERRIVRGRVGGRKGRLIRMCDMTHSHV